VAGHPYNAPARAWPPAHVAGLAGLLEPERLNGLIGQNVVPMIGLRSANAFEGALQGFRVDTYDYFVNKLHAFSADGKLRPASYKRMTDALITWGDLKQPVPPMSKFFDFSFVDTAWK
jgi:hypothetical protein